MGEKNKQSHEDIQAMCYTIKQLLNIMTKQLNHLVLLNNNWLLTHIIIVWNIMAPTDVLVNNR